MNKYKFIHRYNIVLKSMLCGRVYLLPLQMARLVGSNLTSNQNLTNFLRFWWVRIQDPTFVGHLGFPGHSCNTSSASSLVNMWWFHIISLFSRRRSYMAEHAQTQLRLESVTHLQIHMWIYACDTRSFDHICIFIDVDIESHEVA